MPSCRSNGQIQRTHFNCDRARNEQQKNVLLKEFAKLQTTRAVDLNARCMVLLQRSDAIAESSINTRGKPRH
jgi:hypothetical protein